MSSSVKGAHRVSQAEERERDGSRLAPPRHKKQDFRGLLKRIFLEAKSDNLPGESAKVAFYFFLSLFPAILTLFSLTGFVGGEAAFDWIMGSIRRMVPQETASYLARFVRQITSDQRAGILSLGLLLTLWSASTGVSALTDAMNRMYDVEETRNWFKRRGIALGLLVAITVLLIGATTIIVAGPSLVDFMGLDRVMTVLRWPIGLAAIVFLLWLLYYVLPNRDQRHRMLMALLGAVVGGLGWLAVTGLFRLYIANFGRYSETYGFVGSVIVLMLWLQLTAMAILFGGEVASTVEQWRTDRLRRL